MTRATLAALAAALILGLLPSGAAYCYEESPLATLETPATTLYAHLGPCNPDCISFLWVYEESNGIPGLQRDDDYTRSCDAGEPADTLLVEW